MQPRRSSRQSSQAGFSLIEMLIAMFVLTEVMAAILLLFTGLTDIARAQTNVAEVQQIQRVSHRSMIHQIRETGLGGLPASVEGPQGVPGVFPNGLAIAVRNNVVAPAQILSSAAPGSSDEVLAGSDVLILRGVFATPVYYVSPQLATVDLNSPGSSLLTGATAPFSLSGRQLTIPGQFLEVRQDFQPLIDAITASTPRVLIVRDLLNPQSYGLLEVTGIATLPGACIGGCITLNVSFTNVANVAAYSQLVPPRDGSHPLVASGAVTVPFPKRIGAVGLLEEIRYYVRPDNTRRVALADRATTISTPVLSRIEVLPNTDVQIGNRLDIADNIFDLQVAVGIDTSPACTNASCSAAVLLERGRITEDGTATDEVFFNHPADDTVANLPDFSPNAIGRPEFHFVRLTSLVFAARVERGHMATPIGQIEDRVRRNETVTFDGDLFNYATSLPNYRRRLLSTVIDLRNLR